jgi:hypothetical protein
MELKLRRGIFGALAAFGMTAESVAAVYHCDGVPQGVSVGPGGQVLVMTFGSHPFTYSHWCNVTVTTSGVAPETCRAMLTIFLSAEAQGKTVRVWFDDASTCATRGSWSQQVLYLGPMILPN